MPCTGTGFHYNTAPFDQGLCMLTIRLARHGAKKTPFYHVTVADSRCIWLRQTFEATRPLSSDDPDALARAIGESMDDVARATGDAVRKALTGRCGR